MKKSFLSKNIEPINVQDKVFLYSIHMYIHISTHKPHPVDRAITHSYKGTST